MRFIPVFLALVFLLVNVASAYRHDMFYKLCLKKVGFKPTFFVGNPGNCYSFYRCDYSNQKLIGPTNCAPGTVWSPNKMLCDYASEPCRHHK
ncbi:uncharacterized protein B0P05DRAFT_531584 [Gilbertella persicaria]|uniref:Chitin-binding type-2 domain-containing protein n=1 Tax=Rhizopus stolonifer TaxID=4846 RepID=A0A367KMF8_RHIST|nr:uncharacterized protein B0P05DRAFT_531584 [Gilbertella persicaria]KAI8087599.1 hypothetical protein B0P05DRAFT_531584 [Gilbertella persicaria]RCI03348.1 hypothetical protein CU098_004951 [Rhizopus stolonifer]